MLSVKRQEKNELTIALLILFLISSTWVYFKYFKDLDTPKVIATNEVRLEVAAVPQPTDPYVIRHFFELADEGKVNESLDLMIGAMAQDDDYQKILEISLDNFYYVKVRTLDQFRPDLWTENKHKYILRLDVQLNDPNLPTGWQNGENVRYVTVSKIGDQWKISEINAAP